MQNEGFRANSQYNRHSLNITGKHQLNEKSTLSFIGVFTKLKAFIPSSINETDFLNNPEVAASNWSQAEGFESYDKVLLGLNYDVKLSSKVSLATSVFGTYKNAYEPRPFDILDDKTGRIHSGVSFSICLRCALDEIKKEIIGNSDNSFTFDSSYNNVFIYGKEVDDFHTLDKQKILALHNSAIQELDKQIKLLKEEIKLLKSQ